MIEAIKLVEGGLAELCDEVWLVACDPAVQLERLVGRGDPADDASSRVGAQGDLVERLRGAATRIVDTSGESGRDPNDRRRPPRRGPALQVGAHRVPVANAERGGRRRSSTQAAARTTEDGGPGSPEVRRVSGARWNRRPSGAGLRGTRRR